jgi:O-antigen/teichoic acid export membrane protein
MSMTARSASTSMTLGGALSLTRLLSGLVRVKVLALVLGVEGVGIYAILLQLYLTGVAAVSMSLAVPIINLGRPKLAAGQTADAGSVAGTARAVVSGNALLLVLLAAAFGEVLFGQLGIGATAHGLVWPVALAIVIGACSGAFWDGMSFLCDRFDIYVRVGMIGAITDMLLVAGAAALFGLKGAVYAMPVGIATMFTAYAIYFGRDPTARVLLRNLSAKLGLLPQLFAYSAMMFLSIALTNAGLTYLRSRVLVEVGPTANGYLQTVTSLSAYLLAFVMTGFWGHLHARAAAEGDTPAVRRELAKSLDLGLLISFTGCGVAAVTAPFIIPLCYSHEFTGAADQLIAYMPGELSFQLLSMMVAYQLTVSLRRVYLALSLGYIALLVAIGTLLIPRIGGIGYVVAHISASLAMLGVAGLFGWFKDQFNGRFLATAAAMIVSLGAVSVALLYGRQAGYPPAYFLPALLPFTISGMVVLLRLWKERHPPAPS